MNYVTVSQIKPCLNMSNRILSEKLMFSSKNSKFSKFPKIQKVSEPLKTTYFKIFELKMTRYYENELGEQQQVMRMDFWGF